MSSFDKDPNKVVLYEEGFENEEECSIINKNNRLILWIDEDKSIDESEDDEEIDLNVPQKIDKFSKSECQSEQKEKIYLEDKVKRKLRDREPKELSEDKKKIDRKINFESNFI